MSRLRRNISGVVTNSIRCAPILIYSADGLPVTLKFADAAGEVFISGPAVPKASLPFRHYI